MISDAANMAKKRPGRSWSQTIKNEAKRLHGEGMLCPQISEILGVPVETLRAWRSRGWPEPVVQHKPRTKTAGSGVIAGKAYVYGFRWFNTNW